MSADLGVQNTFKEGVHSKIQKYLSNASDGIDVSNSFLEDKKVYTDIVHLTPAGRKVVTQNIFKSKNFMNAIKSCGL